MILTGIHAVQHALQSEQQVRRLCLLASKQNKRLQELVQMAKSRQITVQMLSPEEFNRLIGGAGGAHQGVAAEVIELIAPDLGQWLQMVDMGEKPLLLILDSVTDPHNFGACLRTAAAAGCVAVVVPRDRSAALNATVAKTACGALAHLTVINVGNLVRALEQLKEAGFWTVGLAGEASQNLWQVNLDGPLAIVMGAEESGLRRLVRDGCDQLAAIPLPGAVESLNVSVATGVALFEVVRRRMQS